MKLDGREIARANLAVRKENQRIGDEAPMDVQSAIMDQGAHIKAMLSLIEAIHSKEPQAAHEALADYSKHYAKLKAE